jgi:RNA polymerase sigma factor (sigma-70 family)
MMVRMRDRSRWTDAELLGAVAACDERAFSVFYRRHLSLVVGWAMRRPGDPELAADLTAEVFAAVLVGAERYQPVHDNATGWILGIARNVLGHSLRRGQVDARARRRLGAGRLAVEDADLERVVELGGGPAAGELLDGLPVDERRAVRARVIEEREYVEIARTLGCSELVARKRVSRGLARLRAGLVPR